MKTGELFALSCDLGACLSGAGAVQRSALRQYGLAVGTAYQVYDDCLDLFGSEASVGKSLGTDLAKGKVTLPLLLALEQATPAVRVEIEAMVQDWSPGQFVRLTKILQDYRTLEGSQEEVHHYTQAAREKLGVLPHTESRDGLIGLTEYLEAQTASIGLAAIG
jgi:octaprenyl-diphosphate synthase